MKIKCTTCKYEYNYIKDKKCPRCGCAASIKSGCENCRGCSIWKTCAPKK